MPPKKHSASIWEFYDKNVNNKGEKVVQCKQCNKTFKDFGNTTNLIKHHKNIHPLIYLTTIEKTALNSSTVPPQISDNRNDKHRSLSIEQHSNSSSSSSICEVIDSNSISKIYPRCEDDQPPPSKRRLQMKLSTRNIVKVNKIVDEALVDMICLDFQPLQIVENIGFRKGFFKSRTAL